MEIRGMRESDLKQIIRIWNESVDAGEVLYRKMDERLWSAKFGALFQSCPDLFRVAETGGKVTGFAFGSLKTRFLPGETAENTPGFLTCIFVDRAFRRQGTGRALLADLEDAFANRGHHLITCSSNNPVNLDWTIPDTPGHDHNNAPGVDEACAGFPFLLASGYQHTISEVAMYLDLKAYRPWDGYEETKARLEREGVTFGPYDARLGYDYDGMCDRVGSEYWREVLRSEIACHLENRPNTDIRFLPNGRVPKGPRPILAATCDRRIVAQVGPVEVQESGRGFFTGICTDPLYERRGIASVLFNVLMQEFIAQGAAFSSIFTGDGNHARRIYERAGFRVVRRWALMKKNL